MTNYELTNEEKNRRKNVSAHTRKMVMSQLRIDDQDETSLMTDYRDYYLQISFSELHPLMVFCVAKGMKTPSTAKQRKLVNELNLKSILGSHAINDEVAEKVAPVFAELTGNGYLEILEENGAFGLHLKG